MSKYITKSTLLHFFFFSIITWVLLLSSLYNLVKRYSESLSHLVKVSELVRDESTHFLSDPTDHTI